MDEADKYFQVRYGLQHNLTEIFIWGPLHMQSWLGWEYKPYVPKTVSINVYVKSAETPCALQGSGSSIWYDNGTMNMQVVDVSVGRTTM